MGGPVALLFERSTLSVPSPITSLEDASENVLIYQKISSRIRDVLDEMRWNLNRFPFGKMGSCRNTKERGVGQTFIPFN